MKSRHLSLKFMVLSGLIALGIIAFLLFGKTPQNTLDKQPTAFKGLSFSLTSDQGPVTLSQFKGKWVLLYLGYTFCPDICPTNLSSLVAAYQQLPTDQQAKIQLMFVSVDPERDTPKRLAKYSHYFDPSMLGLTGERQALDKLVQALGAAYKLNKKEGKHYSVDHSAFTYLINPAGKLMKMWPHGTTSETYLQQLSAL